MEIFKSADGRTIDLESYAIERLTSTGPVIVRAKLRVKTPSDVPAVMQIQVEYEYDGFPEPNEQKFGQRLLRQIVRRIDPTP
jgi:hypothetical protein